MTISGFGYTDDTAAFVLVSCEFFGSTKKYRK